MDQLNNKEFIIGLKFFKQMTENIKNFLYINEHYITFKEIAEIL